MDDPIGALNRDAPMPAMNFGPRVKPRKAARPHECETFEQLPNVGPAMAGDLRALGLQHPRLHPTEILILFVGRLRPRRELIGARRHDRADQALRAVAVFDELVGDRFQEGRVARRV